MLLVLLSHSHCALEWWIRDIAYNLTHDLLKEYFDLWTAIDSIRPDLDESSEDTIVWTLESSGQYSSKSAYAIQFAGQVQSSFPALIWNAWAPPKCKFFLWLLLQNRLWTSARLQLRHWKNNYFCALCERNLETAHHLFFECPYSRLVWQLVATWSGCPSLQPTSWKEVLELEDCFNQTIRAGWKKEHTLAILTVWNIWNRRNAVDLQGRTKGATFPAGGYQGHGSSMVLGGMQSFKEFFS